MKKKLLSKLLPKSTITIYYDGYCAFCNKIVSKWKEKDHYEKLIFKSFREESVQAEIAVSLIDLDKEIHAKNNDNNKMYKGIYVVTEVSKRIPSLWFMVPLLYLSQITNIGNLVYRLIAKNRTIIPVNKCTDDICNINNV